MAVVGMLACVHCLGSGCLLAAVIPLLDEGVSVSMAWHDLQRRVRRALLLEDPSESFTHAFRARAGIFH